MSKVILLCKTTLLKHGWEADDETLDKACQDLSLDDQDSWASMTTLEDWTNLFLCIVCLAGAAMAAGLTVAVVSLEEVDLRVKLRTGSPEEQIAAEKLLPLVTLPSHHRLLVTLLLCNSIFNETLPVVLDTLVPSWAAVLVAVTAVLFFGEIIPSAVFTGPRKLALASHSASFVWFMLGLLKPLAAPIAWGLDTALPEENDTLTRNDVLGLVAVHREIAQEEGYSEPFGAHEEALIKGALSLSTLTLSASQLVKPFGPSVFSLPLNARMDASLLDQIMAAGFSRVPIHLPEDKTMHLGYLLTKEHVPLVPDDATPLAALRLYKPVCVSPDSTLASLLKDFSSGGSHMAFVCRDPSALQRALNDLQAPLRAVQTANQEDGQGNGKETPSLAPEPLLGALQSAHAQSALNAARAAGLIGVVTLEDVLEVLLSEELFDEAEYRMASEQFGKWLSVHDRCARARSSLTTRRAFPDLRSSVVYGSLADSLQGSSSLRDAKSLNHPALLRRASGSDATSTDNAAASPRTSRASSLSATPLNRGNSSPVPDRDALVDSVESYSSTGGTSSWLPPLFSQKSNGTSNYEPAATVELSRMEEAASVTGEMSNRRPIVTRSSSTVGNSKGFSERQQRRGSL